MSEQDSSTVATAGSGKGGNNTENLEKVVPVEDSENNPRNNWKRVRKRVSRRSKTENMGDGESGARGNWKTVRRRVSKKRKGDGSSSVIQEGNDASGKGNWRRVKKRVLRKTVENPEKGNNGDNNPRGNWKRVRKRVLRGKGDSERNKKSENSKGNWKRVRERVSETEGGKGKKRVRKKKNEVEGQNNDDEVSTTSRRRRRRRMKRLMTEAIASTLEDGENVGRKRRRRRKTKPIAPEVNDDEPDLHETVIKAESLILPSQSLPYSSRRTSDFETSVSVIQNPPLDRNSSVIRNSSFLRNRKTSIDPKEQYKLNQMIDMELIPFQNKLSSEIVQLKKDLHDMEMKRDFILKETKEIYDEVCLRLNAQFTKKHSSNQLVMNSCASKIDRIENFLHKVQVGHLSTFSSEELIMECQHLLHDRNIVESAFEKEQTNGTDPEDLPREMFELHTMKRKYEELKKVVGIKDDVIKELVLENKQLQLLRDEEVKKVSKLYLKTKEELYRWISIAKKRKKGNDISRKSMDDILLQKSRMETTKIVADLTSSVLRY